ncbi:MAG: adventurous gliding motility protein CglF [Myxococcales bacterium]|nr:adventurous gliding motility protein CglF [Myxococcales bacterium]
MKRTLLATLAALSLVSFAAPAGAQDKGAAPGGDSVQYKSKTVYDFDDDVVEGDLVRPDGEFVDSRKAAKHSSLIKIRPDFIPEMLKSAEDI